MADLVNLSKNINITFQMKNFPAWDFEGDTVYLSGGAWGIGRAIVTLFARSGAKVVFGDIDTLHGTELQETLRCEGCNVRFLTADFSYEESWHRMLSVEPNWKPTILISNVGVSALMPIEDLDIDRYDRVQAINQRSALIGAKLVVPHMKKVGKGVILFVGSIMAKTIFNNSVVYVATKTALEGITRALSVDLGPSKIRVNCVLPGYTRVGMYPAQRAHVPEYLWSSFSDRFAEELDGHFARQQPLATGIDAVDIAQTVAFLSSDAAQCITGVSLPVDGALALQAAYDPEVSAGLAHWSEEMERWLQDQISH